MNTPAWQLYDNKQLLIDIKGTIVQPDVDILNIVLVIWHIVGSGISKAERLGGKTEDYIPLKHCLVMKKWTINLHIPNALPVSIGQYEHSQFASILPMFALANEKKLPSCIPLNPGLQLVQSNSKTHYNKARGPNGAKSNIG